MQKLNILKRISEEQIMAIVRVDTIERAEEIVQGCLAGQISCVEISYTNTNAGEIIQELKTRYAQKLLVGAGTVLDGETARQAILKGAEFIIAPNFSEDVAKICNRYQIPYMPGCFSVSEVVEALSSGADMIKIFPGSSLIGPDMIKTIKTPLPWVPMLSSGGATPDNISEWLNAGVDCVGVGSLLTKGTAEEIAKNACAFQQKLKEIKKKA
ncbi:bifunctional 2-keto-4-hydroxyglutarate aldolase/2-keto-3-deoxy-6-phosphogluconate aldolase [Candidatus Enterococcus willemsii]|uniref:Ketohydroxyglutarate aldolase n=1 Tax=Candidatus Enterococcus willemsii TaxID=1857215 RepID=A0ABQ6Z1N4_9ENTE|nr:bifunctional 2-keto-4-hydroxyglutarate aldolase/2-keto-3-deoxy-6-phosphogluconate aldolase [Enterococcus sp. CU12B]KAF1305138.1 ketohydroxyglutarate aldolase [Enterococcus sp. CU12B]